MDDEWRRLWKRTCEGLERIGAAVLDVAPDDALTRAEGLRYVERLFRYAIGRQLELLDPSRPKLIVETVRIGGDNPDYRYAGGPLDGNREYRLRGRMNDSERAGFGTFAGGVDAPGGLISTGAINSGDLPVDDEGWFELAISQQPPAEGAWLPMRAETNALLIRELALKPAGSRPAEFIIASLSPPSPAPVPGPEDLAGRLERAIRFVEGTVPRYLDWTAAFAARPNEIYPTPPELLATSQGDPSTLPFNGYYDLKPDEALIVTLRPPRCDYWNLQACNHWLESLDPAAAPAHYNNATAMPRADGSVVLVIAASDPEAPNWIDTAGHLHGCIAMRIVSVAAGETVEPPGCRVVPLAAACEAAR